MTWQRPQRQEGCFCAIAPEMRRRKMGSLEWWLDSLLRIVASCSFVRCLRPLTKRNQRRRAVARSFRSLRRRVRFAVAHKIAQREENHDHVAQDHKQQANETRA